RGEAVVLVWMRGGMVTDEYVAMLKGLKNLWTLELDFTAITEKALDTVKEFATLESLSLDRATKVGDAGLEKLAGLTKLQSLSLTACNLSDKAGDVLAKFTALRSLRLDVTPIGDAGVAKLAKLA